MRDFRVSICAAIVLVLMPEWKVAGAELPKQTPAQHYRPSAKPPQNQSQPHASQPDVSQAIRIPLVVAIPEIFTPIPEEWTHPYQPETQPEPTEQSWQRRTAVAQTVFDGLLVIVGCLQAYLIFLQYKTYEGQRRIMRRQANIASQQAGIMAQQRTLMSTQATTMVHQLAYLEALERPQVMPIFERTPSDLLGTLNLLGSDDPVPSHYTIRIAWRVKNYGNTAAILESLTAFGLFGNKPPPEDSIHTVFRFNLPQEVVLEKGSSTQTLACGRHREARAEIKLTPDLCADVRDNKIDFWYIGEIQYRDVFGWRHTHHFVWRYHFAARLLEPYPAERNRTVSERLNQSNAEISHYEAQRKPNENPPDGILIY
jgi:cell division protein FtsL